MSRASRMPPSRAPVIATLFAGTSTAVLDSSTVVPSTFTIASSQRSSESGQALPSFVMVAPLLLMVSLALLGLAMALHVRVIVLDSAAEGARFGSHTSLELARSRTSELIGAALPREYGEQVNAVYRDIAGVPVVEVSVVCPIPMFGMVGPATMEVRAHAAVE